MTVERKLTPDLGTDSYHADKYAYAVKRLSYRYNRLIFFSALAFIALIFCLSGFQYLREPLLITPATRDFPKFFVSV